MAIIRLIGGTSRAIKREENFSENLRAAIMEYPTRYGTLVKRVASMAMARRDRSRGCPNN